MLILNSSFDQELARSMGGLMLALDTLWGGDVLNPKGSGRMIADTWFSSFPLPDSYKHPLAIDMRKAGGVLSGRIPEDALNRYLHDVGIDELLEDFQAHLIQLDGARATQLGNLAQWLKTVWNITKDVIYKRQSVPYHSAVLSATRCAVQEANPKPIVKKLAEILAKQGYSADNERQLEQAIAHWKQDHMLGNGNKAVLNSCIISELHQQCCENLFPYLPGGIEHITRPNVTFNELKGVSFSGSLNYIGRQRGADNQPLYEAGLEINAELDISLPEYIQLLSHEVIPGHVTTFSLLQCQYERNILGFESTLLSIGTPYSTLAEGVANNALLIAYGADDPQNLPYPSLVTAMYLAKLQDEAKSYASWCTWHDKNPWRDTEAALQTQFYQPFERARKIATRWAMHPLIGQLYLPSYKVGTETVTQLIAQQPRENIYPTLFGFNGMVDIESITQMFGV